MNSLYKITIFRYLNLIDFLIFRLIFKNLNKFLNTKEHPPIVSHVLNHQNSTCPMSPDHLPSTHYNSLLLLSLFQLLSHWLPMQSFSNTFLPSNLLWNTSMSPAAASFHTISCNSSPPKPARFTSQLFSSLFILLPPGSILWSILWILPGGRALSVMLRNASAFLLDANQSKQGERVCVLYVYVKKEGGGWGREGENTQTIKSFLLNHGPDHHFFFSLFFFAFLCLCLTPAAHFPPPPPYALIAMTSRHMGSGLLPENVTSLFKPGLMSLQYRSLAKWEDVEGNNKNKYCNVKLFFS